MTLSEFACSLVVSECRNERHTADLRHLGIDILKLAAPIVAQNLKLSRALVGPAGREMSLDSMRRVQTLDLSNSDLGTHKNSACMRARARARRRMLRAGAYTVKDYLHSLSHLKKTDDEACVLLAQVLKVGSPALTALDLRGNVLDVEGDSALATVLRDMTSLT